MLMLTLANAGGIGGGGLVIPCFIVFFYFDERETVAMAALANAEAALIRFVLNFKDRHPEKKQTMIDYDLVIMMLPLALLGSILGIIINELLPALLVIILLTSWLAYVFKNILIKARTMWQKENKK